MHGYASRNSEVVHDDKGYGFIDTGEGKDLFVHFSAVQQEDISLCAKGRK